MNAGRLRMIILGSGFVILLSYALWYFESPQEHCRDKGGVWQNGGCEMSKAAKHR